MTIHIEQLTLKVIIGLLDYERDKPQSVVIDLICDYDYRDDLYIDYAEIVGHIQAKLKEEKYELLENALLGLKNVLVAHYPQIHSLKIKISKPDILPQCSVALSKSWDF